MNRMIARDGDVLYTRVQKAVARKAYDAGQPVVLCPVKLFPFGGFRPSCMVSNREGRLFDDTVFDFTTYNCTLNETGYYASYWLAK